MNRTVAQFAGELADREAIRDCLYRYARGVDRCDEEVLRGVYWEDAFDDRFERRNDEWRIANRKVVVDWFRDYAEAADWHRGPLGQAVKLGGRHPLDASYSQLQLS